PVRPRTSALFPTRRSSDLFDGLMARAADRAAIHRRTLNRSKGPAVWGPRVQADRRLYRSALGELLRNDRAGGRPALVGPRQRVPGRKGTSLNSSHLGNSSG